jgi:LysR family hydrogen peroxide-inducible transcriptional activator
MPLNLRDLEYFVAIADHGHFGKASQAVKVSQPTLSMQLKKLEAQLGGKLVERLPREAILTARGTEVLPLARQILALASSLENRGHSEETRGRLRFGIIPTLSPYLLPKMNRGLRQALKSRRISVTEAPTADLVRMVRDGSLDAAVLSTPLAERGLEEQPLFFEPFLLAVSRSHPLARRKRVALRDLQCETLLLLEEGHCLRNQALSVCKRSQGTGDTDLTATSIETLRSMVALGAGVTLVPQLARRSGDYLCYIPIADPGAGRAIGIIKRPSYSDPQALSMLAETLRVTAAREHLPLITP